jgi:hypothetical protein
LAERSGKLCDKRLFTHQVRGARRLLIHRGGLARLRPESQGLRIRLKRAIDISEVQVGLAFGGKAPDILFARFRAVDERFVRVLAGGSDIATEREIHERAVDRV